MSSLSIMIKPSSSNCNLACEYCFYHSVSCEREEYSKGMMSNETAQKIIDKSLDFTDVENIFYTFQGGEPLLQSLEFYQNFINYVNQNNTKNIKINYCLQTNATLITPEFAEFFQKNDFLIGVSLDGDEINNKYRVYPNKTEAFNDIVKGINLLKKYNVKFNTLSVLTKNTALNFRKSYRFFKSNSQNYMQFILGLRPFQEIYQDDMYVSVDDYSYFLDKCFTVYYNDILRGENVSIRQFDNYILMLKEGYAEQCGMNGTCSTQFVVEGDGSVYPCDFYCIDEWLLGNINNQSFDELYNSSKMVEFIKESFKLVSECKECKYFNLCRGGGCKRNRADKNYCVAYKNFFSKNLDRLQELVRVM